MSKPVWESHFESAGGVVTDEIRGMVKRMATAGMPNAGDALASVLIARSSVCQAEKALREMGEALREMGEAGKRGAKAGRANQSNHHGKRKQGRRNRYATKWMDAN